MYRIRNLINANGNMTRDRNKGIYNITYNVLNLPERIRYYDGHEVQYTYAADGRKLHVDYLLNLFPIIDDEWGNDPEPQPFPSPNSTGNLLSGGDGLNGGLPGQIDPIVFEPQVLMTRDWCGSHIYRNGMLERIENDYGFWADSCYHYRIADYQGNVRAVISQNGVLEEVNGYYPYGGLMGAASAGVQPNKYGDKELDRQNGLDWLDSQARMYDPLIGRTPTMDSMSEKYYPLSPYLWCAGNPVILGDFEGADIVYLNDNMGIRTVKHTKDPSILVVYPDGEKKSFADITFGMTSIFTSDWHMLERHTVASIYGYYAKQLGVSGVDAATALGADNELAYTSGGTIWLSPNQEGKASSLLNNRYNLLNNIYHESLHQGGDKKGGYAGHLGVYLKSMKHATFKNTSSDYKTGQFSSFAKGLLHAYYSGDKKQRNAAIRMLKEFNRSGFGARMRWDTKNKGIHIWINGLHGNLKYDEIFTDGDGYNF